ncbi:hypothetical protein [Enterobacter asburiae]|uniref:hypothetical protein n=1 Tax=Enterobacter asburiae TaxID=61645 RepID=UPI0011D2214D|nr:hypothetical protein [Enterobacter asburiae]
MDTFVKANIAVLFSSTVAILSLVVAIVSLVLNKRNSRLSSYNVRGSYAVVIKRKSWLKRYLFSPNFTVKIHDSVVSDVIDFDYQINVISLLGGIRRTQIFDDLEDREYIGINKTVCVVDNLPNRKKFPLRYAHQDLFSFYSTPLFPYFSAMGKNSESDSPNDRLFNRYHRYIEITDFCGNTEIWYFSFSLYLSNLDEDFNGDSKWRYCQRGFYKYYQFADFTIVSPNDMPKNLKAALTPQKTFSEIRGGEEAWQPSELLMNKGFHRFDGELQLYELREYYLFLAKLS